MSGLALNISTEETMLTNKKGIVSILGSDTTQTPTAKVASLRRTLSADMSSKKWLSQQGFSPLKRVASSHQFPDCSIIDLLSSSSEDEDYEERKNKKPGQFDMWSSIISCKPEEDSSKSSSIPYVHPLVKKTTSALTVKSLEICTESLGSETGSDGFSSYAPSETGDMQENHNHKEEEQEHVEEPRIIKHQNYDVVSKKSTHNPSFPPPIPSLSRENVRIKTHRDNGRLVLEAVSMPSKHNFVAERQHGRLVLTFSNTNPTTEEDEEAEFEKQSEINSVDEERFSGMEQAPKLSIGATNVHRLAVMMNKPIWLANRNPTWPKNFDDIVKFGDDKVELTTKATTPPSLAQSLPPRPLRMTGRMIPSTPASTTAATSFNAYEYYWRRPNNLPMSKNLKAYNNDQQQELVVLVPLSKGCKEQPRRSLVFWEPYYIATS